MEKIICGIYKITSPSGKIYIGQSINIYKRWGRYKYLNCKNQCRLYNSLIKYGYNNHIFEIIKECNSDSLNKLEEEYVLKYNSVENGLNLRYGGGSCGKLSKESKEKLRKANTGRKVSEETKEKLRKRSKENNNRPPIRYRKDMSESEIINLKERMTGKNNFNYGKFGKDNPNFGRKNTQEVIARMSEIKMGNKNPMYGKKQTQEHILKKTKNIIGKKQTFEHIEKRVKYTRGIKRSDDFKKKIGDAFRGKKQSLEHIIKKTESRRGYIPTIETRKKQSEATSKYWRSIKEEKAMMIF
jgi:group I intron endonuclease